MKMDDICERWFKDFDKILHRCFKKIRITKKPPKSTDDFLIFRALGEVKALKGMIPSVNDMCKDMLETEIEYYEKWIAEMQGRKCVGVHYVGGG